MRLLPQYGDLANATAWRKMVDCLNLTSPCQARGRLRQEEPVPHVVAQEAEAESRLLLVFR